MKHKYSTYTLILLAGIFIISIIGQSLDSADLNDLCNTDNSILVRITGVWSCRDYKNHAIGEVSLINNTQTTFITAVNTWSLINGSFNINSNNMQFNGSSNGTLIYIGDEEKFFHIAMTLSVKSAGVNDVVRAVIAKNGTPLLMGQIQLKLGAIGDVSSTAIHVATTLNKGDTLNIYIMNENDADDLIITYANLFAMGMLT